jgi:hypothetical protein
MLVCKYKALLIFSGNFKHYENNDDNSSPTLWSPRMATHAMRAREETRSGKTAGLLIILSAFPACANMSAAAARARSVHASRAGSVTPAPPPSRRARVRPSRVAQTLTQPPAQLNSSRQQSLTMKASGVRVGAGTVGATEPTGADKS